MQRFIRPLGFILALGALNGCATRPVPRDFYGQLAPVSAAERVIVIRPDTKHVNVEGGQIVKFDVGDKSFAWHFLTAPGIAAFKLNDVVPPGILDHTVMAYISPDPRYVGGDGDRGK